MRCAGRTHFVRPSAVRLLLALRFMAVVLVWAATAPSAPLAAQQSADSSLEFCFRGAPFPRCRWFAITEVGVVWLATGSQPDPGFRDSRRRVTPNVNLGIMRNLTPRTAVGAAVLFSDLDADESRTGVQARYRRWLSSTIGLEASVGLLVEANDVASHFHVEPELPGFTGEVRLEWRDLMGVQARVDRLQAGSQRLTDLWLGGRAGGRVGAVGVGILAVVMLIGIASLGTD